MKYHNKRQEKASLMRRLVVLFSAIAILILFFSITSCDKELDVKTDFPFELQVMPVPKSIEKGETVTIQCRLKTDGNYAVFNIKSAIFNMMAPEN